ncbi:MAG: hypothetical protein IJY56_00940 [Clostridia bacterium]|nr:hypothetical protein [Clostridia bacterium]
MTNCIFPTTRDVYIEVDGKKIAAVESYKTTASQENRLIESFGLDEAVANVKGKKTYTLELSRVCMTDSAMSDGVDFYELEDFNIVIVKPDRRIIYSGCIWSRLTESAALGETLLEKVTVSAAGRMCIK